MRGVPASVPGAGVPRLWPSIATSGPSSRTRRSKRFSGDALRQECRTSRGSPAMPRSRLGHRVLLPSRNRYSAQAVYAVLERRERRQHLRGRLARLRRMFAALRGSRSGAFVLSQAKSRQPRRVRSTAAATTCRRKNDSMTEVAPSPAITRAAGGTLRTLGRLASKTRKETFPPPGRGRPYVTGASFLVRANRRGEWKKQAARLAAALASAGTSARDERAVASISFRQQVMSRRSKPREVLRTGSSRMPLLRTSRG